MAAKLSEEIRREQEVIGPYDMAFYAQMANDLLTNVFRSKDEEIEAKEIQLSATAKAEKPAVAEQAEEKPAVVEEAPKKEAAKKPVQLNLAQLMAAKKKKGKGAGGPAKKQEVKAPPKQEAPKKEVVVEAPVLDKHA